MFRFLIFFSLFSISTLSFAKDLKTYIKNAKTYVGGTLLLNQIQQKNFYHLGWNNDSHCYYDMSNCPSTINGYTWIYDIGSVWAPGASLEWGMKFNNWRLEFSLDGMSALKTDFDRPGSYYLSSADRPFPPFSLNDSLFKTIKAENLAGSLTKVTSQESKSTSTTSSISSFHLLTLFANAYYDTPVLWKGLKAYAGAGLGYALVFSRLKYESKNPPDQSQFDALQDAVFLGGSLAGRFTLGLDKAFSDKMSYGLKASYTVLAQELSDALPYKYHLNQEKSQALFQGIKYWTLGVNFKYFIK